MRNKKPPPVKVAKKVEETIIDKVIEQFERYIDVTGAILDDYVVDQDAIMEIAEADKNLIADFRELEEKPDFDLICEQLKNLDQDEVDWKELFDICSTHLDPGDVSDFLTSDGFIYVKVSNMLLKDKLEEFIKKEIIPYYNDQRDNLFI